MNRAEFVKDFSEFYVTAKKEGINASLTDMATLYAIYRNNLRTDKLHG